MIILDTNVVSELRKPEKRCNTQVFQWSQSIDINSTYLSVLTVLEIELGIRQIERRDSHQASTLERWFSELMKLYAKRIVPVDTEVALRAAGLPVPDPKPERDALIAACALTQGYSLATRNTSDFEDMGLLLVNPWGA